MIKVTKQQAVTGIKKGYLKNNGVKVRVTEEIANILAIQEKFPIWLYHTTTFGIGLCRKV